MVPWDPPSWDDLRWWCTEGCLEEGISLALRSPDQMFWSDTSNLGWGATVADQFASGVWLEGEVSLTINQRELLAVERGLRALCACLEGRVVAFFSDNMTAVAYLKRQGGTLSPALNAFVFSRCESSQGTWRRAPSCVLCKLSTFIGELVLLLLEPLLCLVPGQYAYRQFAYGQCAYRSVRLRTVCLPDIMPTGTMPTRQKIQYIVKL